MMKQRVYTTADVASLIMRTRESVRSYCKEGKIKSKLVGGEHLISDASLKEFLGDDIYEGVIDTLPPLSEDEWGKLDKQASKRAVNKVEGEVRDNG